MSLKNRDVDNMPSSHNQGSSSSENFTNFTVIQGGNKRQPQPVVKTESEFTTGEVWSAIISYCFCSFSMLLVNKYVVTTIPYPSVVTALQLLFATVVVSIASATRLIEVESFRYNVVRSYCVYAFSFVGGLYSSMRALSVVNVETIIVFRSCLPLVIGFMDYWFLGRAFPSRRSLFSLAMLCLGGYGYVASDSQFSVHGVKAYTWVLIWFTFMCFSMTYGKQITNTCKLSTWGSVQYNNVISLPFIVVLGLVTAEFQAFIFDSDASVFEIQSMLALLLSCIVGLGISYTGWWARQVVSATSYTLIGVVNKFGTVTVNILVWDKHASPMGLMFLCLCLIASTLYQQAPMRATVLAREMP